VTAPAFQDSRKCGAEIPRQALNHPDPQPSSLWRARISRAYSPIEQNQLAVDGDGGAKLCGLDALLQVRQKLGISGWHGLVRRHNC